MYYLVLFILIEIDLPSFCQPLCPSKGKNEDLDGDGRASEAEISQEKTLFETPKVFLKI